MKDSYILFKDHKPNFENKLQSRLINPSKTESGITSKNIIQNIMIKIQKNLPILTFGRTKMIQLNGLKILKTKAIPLLFNLT